MVDILNVSLIQAAIKWEDIDHNLRYYKSLISDNHFPSRLIILSEMFATGFTMQPKKIATTMDGKVINWLRSLASDKKAVIIGSIAIEDQKKHYNRCVAMYPDGSIKWYDKRHLFRMSGENEVYSQGKDRVIIEIDGWRVALFICYDLRFPVWCRNQNDYDIAVFVANWPSARSFAWETLLSARAIENQCFVLGVNRIGKDINTEYEGGSAVISYDGSILDTLQTDTIGIINSSLNYNELNNFRKKFPVWMDADNFTTFL